MPNISLFPNVAEVRESTTIDLIEYLEANRDGVWFREVTHCRSLKDKKERKAYKDTMPTATLSGTFKYRDDNGLDVHSGYLSIDLDNVEGLLSVKSKLVKDKYVMACWISTGGEGLRVLFKINPRKHNDAFEGISEYLFEKYGVVADRTGRPVSKPFIVSHDPEIYINYNFDQVPVFDKYVKNETVIKKVEFIHTPEDFESVIREITSRNLSICESYQDWIKVGFAICDKFGESGRQYFHEVSRFSSKYKVTSCDKQYNAFLKAISNGGKTKNANIASFYYLAKSAGIKITSERTKEIIRTTVNGKKAGLDKKQIAENLQKFQNISDAESVIDYVFDNDDGMEGKGSISILHSLEMFISSNYTVRMNEVTGHLEQNGKQLTPSDLNTIFLAAKKNIPTLDYQIMMRLLKSEFIPSYNPFYEFFKSDGIPVILPSNPDPDNNLKYTSPLIDKLAETIKNQDYQYTRYFLRKWLVSIISSAHKVHSPLLLALLGKRQGAGKTEFFRRLFPKELQGYYAESKLDKEKDDELLMTENLVIMDDELGGKTKSEAHALKNITSKQYYYIRRPYGDHNEKILRIAVLGGTSNRPRILSDTTGNRRIIPVDVEDIDKELYNSIDKKDLFMEMYNLYKDGFDWRVTYHDIGELNKNYERYETICVEKELIEKYFSLPVDEVNAKNVFLTPTEVLVEMQNRANMKLNITMIGQELEALGFEKRTIRIVEGDSVKFPKKWCLVRRSQDDTSDSLPF